MASPVSSAAVFLVPIDSVVVGVRRRSKVGPLQSLERSIATHGLIHPILLRNGNQLVTGQRRLEACRRLGWRRIPARAVDDLTDEQLRAIEFDENRQRQALNTYDDSKQRLAQIRQAEADLKAKAQAEFSGALPKNSKRGRKGEGRPRQPVAQETVAEETGVSRRERARVERHVELAERYPFMQRGGWVQHAVLEAGTFLDQLTERDRSAVAALLDQDGIPPKKAISILENLVTLSGTARQEIFRLAQSTDPHERQTALTNAAALPPPVDPGLLILSEAEAQLRKAARLCRTVEFRADLAHLASLATELLTSFSEANRNARRIVSQSAAPVDAPSQAS
jgi:Predicted transcriptional regulators